VADAKLVIEIREDSKSAPSPASAGTSGKPPVPSGGPIGSFDRELEEARRLQRTPNPAGSMMSGAKPAGSSPTVASPTNTPASQPAGTPVEKPVTRAGDVLRPRGESASELIDVRKEIEKFQGYSDKAIDAIAARARSHMESGGKVSYWTDGKEIPISKINERSHGVDAKGQPWGMLPLAMGLPGTKNGVELKGLPSKSESFAGRPTPDLSVFGGSDIDINPDDWKKPVGSLPKGDAVGGKSSEWVKAWKAESAALKEAAKARTDAGSGLATTGPVGRLPSGGSTPPPLPPPPPAGGAIVPAGGGGIPPALTRPAGSAFPIPVPGVNPGEPTSPPPPSLPAGIGFPVPLPVVIAGPLPLPVTGDFGSGSGSGSDRDKKPKDKESESSWWSSQQLTKTFRGAGSAMDSAGYIGESVAQNRAGAALGEATNLAIKGLSALGPEGMAAGAALGAVKAGVQAFSDTVDAFVQRGRELSGYNGQLAATVAVTDVQKQLADMREADRLGPQMATLIEKQTQLDLTFRELLAPVKDFLLNVLIRMMDGILEGITAIAKGIDELTAGKIGHETLEELRKIRDMFKGSPDADIAGWLAAGAHFRAPFPPFGPDPRPVEIPLGLPIIVGP
jgi:hypothetical protein